MSNRMRRPFRQKPLKIVIEQSSETGFKASFIGFFKRMFMGLGVVFFLFLVSYVYLIVSLVKEAKPSLPEKIVLAQHFQGDLAETNSISPFAFGPSKASLEDILEGLEKASTDQRVVGMVARISATSYSMAQLYDIKDALKKFRESGKFAYIFADSFGEAGSAMDEYFLAAAFDEIWLQPIGSLGINGFHAENLFFKGLLDRYLVKPQFFQREEYKSAMESFTRTAMSPEAKGEMRRLIDQVSDYYVGEIADARGQNKNQIEEAINNAPLNAQTALKMGLIDKVGYSDELLQKIKDDNALIDEEAFVTFSKYNLANKAFLDLDKAELDAVMGNKDSGHKKIARIVMEGPILSGSMMDEGYSPFSERKVIFSRDYARAITKAANDKNVDALYVRINSPGGSAVASETIRRALVYAKEVKNKPVIVSMSGVVASGGYWISTAADKIYAAPTTITGSIGVISGKFALGDALANYDITRDYVSYGENADFLSPTEPFDAVGRAKINEMLDDIYDAFLQRVADGRGMSVEQVRKIAGGRIWTGMAAKENGLVDELGGIQQTKAGIANMLETDVSQLYFVDYPKHKNPVEQFVAMLNGEWAIMPQSVSVLLSGYFTQWQLSQQSAVQVLYDGDFRP